MNIRFTPATFFLLFLGLILTIGSRSWGQTPQLTVSPVATGLFHPTDMVGLSVNTFLVSQADGRIKVVQNGAVLSTPFLDLSDRVYDTAYNGIFGFALHPDYATNGYIYVHYARIGTWASVYSRFTRSSSNPEQADPASELVLLTVPYPNSGHRGGHIAFGPDGYLYLSTGDSSSGARGAVSTEDRRVQQLAQDRQDLRGKLLRIDVNSGSPYAIPLTNPYANAADGSLGEIFSLGLRNPWRFSFDRQTGGLWIGDIGQDGWEGLNYAAPGASAPKNYGWPCYEGTHPYTTCNLVGAFAPPLLEYPGYNNNGGQTASITGGFVYRGSAYPALQGWYVYGDYSQGTLWTLKLAADGSYQNVRQTASLGTTSVVSFGEDAAGELYAITFSEGGLYRIGSEPNPLPISLRYFSGRMTDAGARLGWATAREENNARFQIERSYDARSFESIAIVPSLAVGGNSVTELTYSYLDTQPLPGINYYRLVQTDRDGTRTTHNIIALSRESAAPVLFPNPVPALGEASIEPGISHTGYTISDMLGRVVQRVEVPGVLSRVSLAGLPTGVYVLHVQTDAGMTRTWRLLR